ncbi:MAG TPA: hypothetical protein PKK10_02195 [Woeseiaceae bacterium]|nr:hypothetical protein [Woeseiaceae bacterium]
MSNSDSSGFPYAALSVRGPDAFGFLQGQLSNDLRRLDGEAQLFSAWCNPKGRVICLLRVRRSDAGYTLMLPADLAQTVISRMALFRFRAKVEFTANAGSKEMLGIDESQSIESWLHEQLLGGVPEIWFAQSEVYTPHMLNLDRLDAISLDKGCYTGQEIVARTHYRGSSKRRMLRFSSSAAVTAGADVYAGAQKIGAVVTAIDKDLLAVIPRDRASDELSVAGATLQPQPLPYTL